jgi:aromatic ring hydroxylase
MAESVGTLTLVQMPKELQRSIRMVAARRQTTIRAWVFAALYDLVDGELSDYPEWRYQTKRGEEQEFFRHAPRSSMGRGKVGLS